MQQYPKSQSGLLLAPPGQSPLQPVLHAASVLLKGKLVGVTDAEAEAETCPFVGPLFMVLYGAHDGINAH